MSSIGIIVNPYSKKNKRKPHFADMLNSLIDEKDEIVKTKSLAHLETTLLSFKEKKYKYIGILGGDGTINLTISILQKIYGTEKIPVILPLKGGTMNVLAKHLAIPTNPQKALKQFKDGHQMTKSLNSLLCNEKLGFIYADGSIPLILEEFYRDKSAHLGAIILTLKLALSSVVFGSYFKKLIRSFPFLIQSNEQSFSTHSLANLASTISSIPLNFPIFWGVDKYTDKFQFQSLTTERNFLILKLFKILFSRQQGQQRYKLNLIATQVKIKSGNHPIKYTLDGELYEDNEINLRLGNKIEFISYKR